jgi:uncharacterized protein (TIGR03000 family)
MTRRFFIGSAALLALVSALLIGGSASAQSTGIVGSSYPYWDTAPSGYPGSSVPVLVPGVSPNMISNAARSSAYGALSSMNSLGPLGGGYLPPYLTANDTGLDLLRNPRTKTDSRAHIWLRLPADAEVWVNGVKTRQGGESRYFYSPPLTPGQQYAYQMRVRWMKDGKPVEETERLLVSAGATMRRDFTRPLGEEKKPASTGATPRK